MSFSKLFEIEYHLQAVLKHLTFVVAVRERKEGG